MVKTFTGLSKCAHQKKRASSDESVDILQQLVVKKRMCLRGLRHFVDCKSVASCQQTHHCKLIVKTCYPQACCKLFHVTSCKKPDFNRVVVTC